MEVKLDYKKTDIEQKWKNGSQRNNNIQRLFPSFKVGQSCLGHSNHFYRIEDRDDELSRSSNGIIEGKKGKVVYGQEPPSGESTTTECGFNCQLLAVITEVAQWGAPSCSQPQPATDNGVRDGRSN